MNSQVEIIGIECEYPEFKYSTTELFDILGNTLSDKVKENILQLGVRQRYFIKPIENYLSIDNPKHNTQDFKEPISDLSASVAKNCITNVGLKLDDISCLIAASENSDYLSPGLSSILVRKIGLSNFIPHFNLQGMACSTFPKLLELGKMLVHNDNDNVLVVISGCNSGWYLPHLREKVMIKNPKEIGETYDRQTQIKKWVSTMFSFLFGDGVSALILSKSSSKKNGIKIGKITHGVNFDKFDFRKACVRLNPRSPSHLYEYELTAEPNVIELASEYSKKVLMKSLGKDINNFDQQSAQSYMSQKDKVMIHTGSLKILDKFKDVYALRNEQIGESYETLRQYGNLTGVSLPTILKNAFTKDDKIRKGLLVGITMGFGLDLVEVERS